MINIAFLNFKGGVGKTSSVQNVGGALAGKGYRTLLIDLDPQHNLTQSFGIEANPSVYNALQNRQPLEIISIKKNLSIVPSNLEMIKLDVELASAVHREYRLEKALKLVKDDYDFVLMDCPPALGLITANALFSAEDVSIFVPVEGEYLALTGYAVLSDALANLELSVTKAFLTKFESRQVISKSVYEALKQSLGEKMFETVIRKNIAISEAQANGQDIYSYNPSSNGAKDYNSLTNEILNHLNL